MALEVLYLIRHSKPVESHPQGDRHRTLSAEGRTRLAALVPRALALGFRADLAVSSPYVRAVETRDAFLRLLASVPTSAPTPALPVIETSRALVPDEDPVDAIAELAIWGETYPRVAVFTHNPFVTELAERLVVTGSVPSAAVDALVFDAPTVLALTFDHGFGPHKGRPEWILHP